MRFHEFVNEGVNDPAIFKVIFVIGGPGSGKSYITGKLSLPSLGYVNINSDIAFEYLMKKHDIDPKMPPEEKEKRDVVRQRAKDITANKSTLAIEGRLGIVIDGTGDDYEKISKLKNNFDALGYNTYLVVVNTKLDVARQRNQQRQRTVPDDIVVDSWYAVQNNIGKFAQIFENISVIDNSGDGVETNQQIQNTYKKIVRFTNQPPNKPVAKKWIEQQTQTNEAAYKGNIGIMEIFKFKQLVDAGKVSAKLWKLFNELIANHKQEEAWELLQKVTDTKLAEAVDIDKGYPIEDWYEDSDSYALVAVAHDGEGREIEVIFTPLHDEIDAIDFDFTRGGTFEKTGEGEAGKIFATVLKALSTYLELKKPQYVLFGSKGESRTSAYQALIRRFASKFGYKQIPYDSLPKEITDQPTPEGTMFVLAKI